MLAGQTYQFGPREKRGLISTENAAQTIASIGALIGVVVIVNLMSGMQGVILAIAFAGVSAAIIYAPIHGRTLGQWVPPIVSFALRKMTGRLIWKSTVTSSGVYLDGREQPAPLPRSLGRLTPLSFPLAEGGELGVIVDRSKNLYIGVLKCRAQKPFSLLDQDEQEYLLDRWADVLSHFAHTNNHYDRIQWIDRTVPDDSDTLKIWFETQADAALKDSEIGRSYKQLIANAGPADVEHEIFITLRLNAGKFGSERTIKDLSRGWEYSGLAKVDYGACRMLEMGLRTLTERLRTADIIVDGMLGSRRLAAVFRTAFEPNSRELMSRISHGSPHLEAGTSWHNAWPMWTHATWKRYWTAPNAVHTTYWIREWPRTPQYVNFLAPLLIQTPATKTVSVTMEVIKQAKAIREANQSLRADEAQKKFLDKRGFSESFRSILQRNSTAQREQQIHSGFSSVRFTGYITVSAEDAESLDEACGRVETSAQASHLEVFRLNTEHDKFFPVTLPLARGLSKRST